MLSHSRARGLILYKRNPSELSKEYEIHVVVSAGAGPYTMPGTTRAPKVRAPKKCLYVKTAESEGWT